MKKFMRKLQNIARRSRHYILNSIFFISIIFLVSTISMGIILPVQQEITVFDQDYRIGARDILEIRVFELPELNQTVRVYEDGSISLSLLGEVGVAGLTAKELEKRLLRSWINNTQRERMSQFLSRNIKRCRFLVL